MDVRSIILRNFMLYEDVALDIPQRGIVLVTGANGAGKSALVEALPVAAWHKTLRGTKPWSSDDGAVVVKLWDGLEIKRIKKPSKTTLGWGQGGQEDVKWENTSKAQAALEARVGTFDVYRRASVFSSADAAHWSIAGDEERKKLVEVLLGFMRFDPALAACKADLHTLRERITRLTADHKLACATQAAEAKRLVEAREGLALVGTTEDITALKQRAAALSLKFGGLRDEEQTIKEALRKLQSAGHAERQASQSAERRAALLASGLCPTCEQPASAVAERYHAEACAARSAAKHAVEAADNERGALEAALAEVNEDREALADKLGDLRSRITAMESMDAQRVHFARILQEAHTAEQQCLARVEGAAAQLMVRGLELNELEAVETVLGLRGVRAHILGRALDGMETIANFWLARIAGPGLRARIKPYTQNQDGAVRDSISMEVEGAGGGYGYYGASQGQRRRIDLALMLALSDLSQAARGGKPGTLWADEIFDSLDTAGTGAVCEALVELASDRAVVVISHSEELQKQLKVDHHVVVEAEFNELGVPVRSWLR